ncbi:hypothetical protein JCM10213_005499 [Rhodosporidiobolus nylandii]
MSVTVRPMREQDARTQQGWVNGQTLPLISPPSGFLAALEQFEHLRPFLRNVRMSAYYPWRGRDLSGRYKGADAAIERVLGWCPNVRTLSLPPDASGSLSRILSRILAQSPPPALASLHLHSFGDLEWHLLDHLPALQVLHINAPTLSPSPLPSPPQLRLRSFSINTRFSPWTVHTILALRPILDALLRTSSTTLCRLDFPVDLGAFPHLGFPCLTVLTHRPPLWSEAPLGWQVAAGATDFLAMLASCSSLRTLVVSPSVCATPREYIALLLESGQSRLALSLPITLRDCDLHFSLTPLQAVRLIRQLPANSQLEPSRLWVPMNGFEAAAEAGKERGIIVQYRRPEDPPRLAFP